MEVMLEPTDGQFAMNAGSPPLKFNFADWLFTLYSHRANKTAYIDDTGTTTYRQLEASARCFASLLRMLGVHAEERVLLVMLDTVELPVAFLGALYAGVVPVIANTLLTSDDYRYMLTHSRARMVIVSGAVLQTVAQALADVENHDCLLVVSQPQVGDFPSERVLSKLIDDIVPMAKPVASSCDDIAFWLYSSGSTGKPKGTVHTHANLYWTSQLTQSKC